MFHACTLSVGPSEGRSASVDSDTVDSDNGDVTPPRSPHVTRQKSRATLPSPSCSLVTQAVTVCLGPKVDVGAVTPRTRGQSSERSTKNGAADGVKNDSEDTAKGCVKDGVQDHAKDDGKDQGGKRRTQKKATDGTSEKGRAAEVPSMGVTKSSSSRAKSRSRTKTKSRSRTKSRSKSKSRSQSKSPHSRRKSGSSSRWKSHSRSLSPTAMQGGEESAAGITTADDAACKSRSRSGSRNESDGSCTNAADVQRSRKNVGKRTKPVRIIIQVTGISRLVGFNVFLYTDKLFLFSAACILELSVSRQP